jgi:hypothetical protein
MNIKSPDISGFNTILDPVAKIPPCKVKYRDFSAVLLKNRLKSLFPGGIVFLLPQFLLLYINLGVIFRGD